MDVDRKLDGYLLEHMKVLDFHSKDLVISVHMWFSYGCAELSLVQMMLLIFYSSSEFSFCSLHACMNISIIYSWLKGAIQTRMSWIWESIPDKLGHSLSHCPWCCSVQGDPHPSLFFVCFFFPCYLLFIESRRIHIAGGTKFREVFWDIEHKGTLKVNV